MISNVMNNSEPIVLIVDDDPLNLEILKGMITYM